MEIEDQDSENGGCASPCIPFSKPHHPPELGYNGVGTELALLSPLQPHLVPALRLGRNYSIFRMQLQRSRQQ